MRGIAISIGTGVVSSLVTAGILRYLEKISEARWWAAVVAVGVIAFFITWLFTRRGVSTEEPSLSDKTDAVTGITAKGDVTIKDVNVEFEKAGDVKVVSGVRSKEGGIEIKGVSVRQKTSKDGDANDTSN